jgi:hypothetical protein
MYILMKRMASIAIAASITKGISILEMSIIFTAPNVFIFFTFYSLLFLNTSRATLAPPAHFTALHFKVVPTFHISDPALTYQHRPDSNFDNSCLFGDCYLSV